MERSHYIVRLRLDGVERMLIWFTEEEDGVVTLPDGRLALFAGEAELRAHAASLGIAEVRDDTDVRDLDAVARWCRRPLGTPVDCVLLLNAWNLFWDVCASLDAPFDEDRPLTNKVYDKLFYGNNLPSVTPKGKRYVPRWSDDERLLIAAPLGQGLAALREQLGIK